ncbi:hypothetical protein HK102_006589, partial [Quaeritorhiza haematococci]
FLGTADVNRQMLAQQALLNYWNQNNTWYPPNVKFEIVYGGHNGSAGKAILESVRLVNDEKVAFYMSHSPSPTVISEQNIVNIFNTLHCGTIATANELSDKAVARTFYRTVVPTKHWGYAAADFLMKWDLRRVAILAEEGSVCQSMLTGFSEAAARNNITILVTRFLPSTVNNVLFMRNYRYGYDWAQYIKSVRDSGARIVIHCGYASFYSLFDEAAKQGYIQNHEMFFIGTPQNNLDINNIKFTNYTHILPYLYGAMTLEVARNDAPPPTLYSTTISDILTSVAANPPFLVKDVLERKEDTIFPSCLYTAIPTMSELVKRGLLTWNDIANGLLLTKVPFARFMQVMNEIKLSGPGGKPFAFDPKTADPVMELYIGN